MCLIGLSRMCYRPLDRFRWWIVVVDVLWHIRLVCPTVRCQTLQIHSNDRNQKAAEQRHVREESSRDHVGAASGVAFPSYGTGSECHGVSLQKHPMRKDTRQIFVFLLWWWCSIVLQFNSHRRIERHGRTGYHGGSDKTGQQ